MKKLLLILCACGVLAILGCGNRDEPGTAQSGDATLNPQFAITWWPNPIGPRPNPLGEYIQDNWTNGDTESTAGAHYGHIKTYGHIYSTLSQSQAEWVVNHFDMYMGKPEIANARDGSGYPTMLFGRELANTDHIDNWGVWLLENYFLDDPELNPSGYTLDDMLMHYAYDTERTAWGFTPGWNPADDLDGDGIRDVDPPTDPNRTAGTLEAARTWAEPYPGIQKYLGTLTGVERHAGVAGTHAYYNSPGQRTPDFVHFDVVSHESDYALWCQIDRTLDYCEYDSDTWYDQYCLDQPYFVAATTSEYENLSGGQAIISLGNMVSGRYSCEDPVQSQAAHEYLENVWCEGWIETGSGITNNLATTEKRERTLSCPINDWLEDDKGYVCTGYDPGVTERGKRFTLTMFYMVNHQNAFYHYTTHGHSLQYPGELIQDFQWNWWVIYDIGQPVVNNLSKPDFNGQYNTNKYFVYESGTDYEVLGRCYQRDDGTNILVLVKLMDKLNEGGDPSDPNVEDEDPDTISLPGYYKKLLGPGGALAAANDSVILTNNDGAILIESDPPGGGGGGGKINPGG